MGQNPDLRKKLRVDRIRKMGMAQTDSRAMAATSKNIIEDHQEPNWKKMKHLDEIKLFRDTNKDHLISNVMSSYNSNAQVVPLIPGQIIFETIRIVNDTGGQKLYTI
jgi:hypothetical protein